mmetsp:Transcript_60313/g.174071  ORF Transcript_60313/g.174071 Transcript_60313/m.174071 type:complete len:331 (-) Transcript_60313:1174-2166(-)
MDRPRATLPQARAPRGVHVLRRRLRARARLREQSELGAQFGDDRDVGAVDVAGLPSPGRHGRGVHGAAVQRLEHCARGDRGTRAEELGGPVQGGEEDVRRGVGCELDLQLLTGAHLRAGEGCGQGERPSQLSGEHRRAGQRGSICGPRDDDEPALARRLRRDADRKGGLPIAANGAGRAGRQVDAAAARNGAPVDDKVGRLCLQRGEVRRRANDGAQPGVGGRIHGDVVPGGRVRAGEAERRGAARLRRPQTVAIQGDEDLDTRRATTHRFDVLRLCGDNGQGITTSGIVLRHREIHGRHPRHETRGGHGHVPGDRKHVVVHEVLRHPQD